MNEHICIGTYETKNRNFGTTKQSNKPTKQECILVIESPNKRRMSQVSAKEKLIAEQFKCNRITHIEPVCMENQSNRANIYSEKTL